MGEEPLSAEIAYHGKSLRALKRKAPLGTSLLLVSPAKNPVTLTSPIVCEGHPVGRLEVRLHEKRPDATAEGGDSPFLAEEKVLLDDICRKVSEFVTSLNRMDALIERKKVRAKFFSVSVIRGFVVNPQQSSTLSPALFAVSYI
jgi:hypothetical protein